MVFVDVVFRMRIQKRFWTPLFVMLLHTSTVKAGYWSVVKEDYQRYYAYERMIPWASSLAIGAVLANTTTDASLNAWYQNYVRSAYTDHLSKQITLPMDQPVFKRSTGLALYVPSYTMQRHASFTHPSIETWSQLSLRTLALLVPQQALLTLATGGCRPTNDKGSFWRWGRCSRGVSGHAAYGAVPFLSLAKMQDNSLGKAFFYTVALLPGFARINDQKHYASQVWLGYSLAFLASHSLKLSYRF